MCIPKRDDMLTFFLCLCFDKLEGRVGVVGEWHWLLEERRVVVGGRGKIPFGFGGRESWKHGAVSR